MTGDQLFQWRKSLGYTQKQAADVLGTKLRTYQAWETGGASRIVELATQAVSIKAAWGAVEGLRKISALIQAH